jgi:serine/threonine protein kinase
MYADDVHPSFRYIKEKKKLEESEARIIFSQTAQALEYMHSNGIVHRWCLL